MNRTMKDGTVRRFYYESHDQLREHLADFISAYNFGGRLKTLKGAHALPVHLRGRGFQPRTLARPSKCRD
jgi:hypothetical protein